MSEIWLLSSIMAPSLEYVSDSELVEQSRRRFIVFKQYKKDHTETLCNYGEEIDEAMYEAFKDFSENGCCFDQEKNGAIQKKWGNFKESYEEEEEENKKV